MNLEKLHFQLYLIILVYLFLQLSTLYKSLCIYLIQLLLRNNKRAYIIRVFKIFLQNLSPKVLVLEQRLKDCLPKFKEKVHFS
jgi:hypothetical protein